MIKKLHQLNWEEKIKLLNLIKSGEVDPAAVSENTLFTTEPGDFFIAAFLQEPPKDGKPRPNIVRFEGPNNAGPLPWDLSR